jgi:hypothetical protein
MQLNIIQFIKDIYFNLKQILCVYFTPFPYYLYSLGSKNSNLAICGIGLGLIQSQGLFWFSISILICIYIFKQNINIFVYFFCVVFSFFLIDKSWKQTRYLFKLINVQD